ncbi:conjugal transfer protein TrbG [Mesorhizobium sp. M4B.F.Ca.ET.190.01.1.1]|uniref:TrbG/VirB9 family P-type conjugative transfer protein n=1 Tax=unclassified Mesorhizobium TaxID=325217 RepID=UPI0010929C19|nr:MULTISPECIES: TrbG/VirB9 family P-type conjugative transfer protein [unclassified Mesorhizobium]TGR00920.1 conjugal transfer protein TrbG [Mesorhizobium sp. M4B.F.Ca.ET.200.01.1.1]TGS12637.1 conjugal transfer protein TrbG [Mesorhizobium sp. M4B.F.Ca.ET.190.01.1.1]TGT25262.1 conjugal transfer protein TrbG [Mesorhizobium sp. M4B.F.Ca.ET.172.01.1.1]
MMKRLLFSAAFSVAIQTHAHGAQTPRPGDLDGRVTSVVYQPNNVVTVNATYGISTMIIFDEDEKFETISLGDTESWQVAPSEKGNILFVKPVAKNVTTNMNVVTTKRIYFIELHDYAPEAGRKVFGVRFVYPEKDLNAALRKEAEYRAANPNVSNIDKANVNIDYSFSGDAALKPSMIFDDGKKTFFKFNVRVPGIFAVQSDFSETLRNFRKEGEYLVVDGVATQYTLRDGDQWTCIFNLRKPDFGTPDPDVLGPAADRQAEKRSRSGN